VDREIEGQLRWSFAAAEAFARRLAPDDPGVVEDLWLHWESPAPFAAKHPEWYLSRWKLDLRREAVDWSAQDANVWSYLQDCLGVRGLTAIVPPDATPSELMAALDRSSAPLPDTQHRWTWVSPDLAALGTEAFLAEASRQVRASAGRVLVQLLDSWSDDRVLTTLPADEPDTMERLAREADFVAGEGLRILGAD
jgi:hypothetical protein